MEMNTISEKKHFYWLDLIRFGAAFFVMIGHLRGDFFIEYGTLPSEQQNIITFCFYSITRLGHEAVLIFFVMSGFLVGGKTLFKIKNRIFDIRSYCIDRSVRIMLPLISSLLLIWCINVITGVENNPIAFIGNLLSLQGILVGPVSGPLWSLSYEVWFYVIMGAIALFFTNVSTKKQLIAFVTILLGCIVFTKLSFVYLIIWFMGAITFFVKHKKNLCFLFISAFLCIILISLQLITSGSESIESAKLHISREVLELLFTFSFCLFLQQIVLYEPKSKNTIILNKLGSKLANFSYTLYLTHYPIIKLLIYCGFPRSTQINVTSILFYLIGILICLISGYFIYWIFERQTSAIKQFIKQH